MRVYIEDKRQFKTFIPCFVSFYCKIGCLSGVGSK